MRRNEQRRALVAVVAVQEQRALARLDQAPRPAEHAPPGGRLADGPDRPLVGTGVALRIRGGEPSKLRLSTPYYLQKKDIDRFLEKFDKYKREKKLA